LPDQPEPKDLQDFPDVFLSYPLDAIYYPDQDYQDYSQDFYTLLAILPGLLFTSIRTRSQKKPSDSSKVVKDFDFGFCFLAPVAS
jgi:hypothetical protein